MSAKGHATDMAWAVFGIALGFLLAGTILTTANFGDLAPAVGRLARVAPLLTALIAVTAAWVAWNSLKAQRDIARKRAALDLFFKTEMDKTIATAFEHYEDHIELLKKNPEMPVWVFRERHKDAYLNIVSCLNIHELVAVGIFTQVLDEEVCYQFWSDALIFACRDARPIMEYIRTGDGGGSKYTYADMVKLAARWMEREKREAAALS